MMEETTTKTTSENTAETDSEKATGSLIEGMFEVGAHYGYSRSRRHPSFAPLIFGVKEGNDVINLEKTTLYLNKALSFIKESVRDGKVILFIGTKPEVRGIVEKTATSLSAPYVVNRWIGGLITNFEEIKKRVKKLDDWIVKREQGELDVYTKVERMSIDEEIDELVKNFGGITTMHKIPDVVCVVDPRHEDIAVAEARKKGIPIVALIGSDGDLKRVDYPIPANDSNVESVSFFMEQIAKSYKEGLAEQKPQPAEGSSGESADKKPEAVDENKAE